MALLLAINRILGNKHELKTILKKQFTGLLLMSLLAYATVPQNALAFEAELKNSPARKLVAPVKLLHTKEFHKQTDLMYQADYSSRMASSVISHPPAETKMRKKKTVQKIAYLPKTRNTGKPNLSQPMILQGEASYYSRDGCLGCNPARIMANGQPLNDNALTMAIGANLKHLVGHKAKVTNLHTSQSVDVLITDTGGFYQAKYGSRVADLTIATKQAIGMNGGVGQVKVEVY